MSNLNGTYFHGLNTFPYDLNKLSKKRRNERDYSILKYTPFGNTMVVDMAIQLLVEEGLGKDDYTDYLALNFCTLGPVANTFGQESIEMEDVMIRMDLQLTHFLKSVEDMLGKENVLIFLTASRGMPKESTYFKQLKLPVGKFNRNQALSLLKSYLNVKYGTGNWVRGFFGNQIYLNRILIEDADIQLIEIRDNVVNFMVQFAGVAHAITASTLYSAHFDNNLFDKKFDIDEFVSLKSQKEISNYISTKKSKIIRDLFSDDYVKLYLNVNYHEDVWYYSKEAYEELSEWILSISFIKYLSHESLNNSQVKELITKLFVVNKYLLDSSDQSGFQLEKLETILLHTK